MEIRGTLKSKPCSTTVTLFCGYRKDQQQLSAFFPLFQMLSTVLNEAFIIDDENVLITGYWKNGLRVQKKHVVPNSYLLLASLKSLNLSLCLPVHLSQ